jgi:hypothetical protein
MTRFHAITRAASVVLAVLINTSALAQSGGDIGTIEFIPLHLKESSGAKLEQAVLTYAGQSYEVRVNGLGVGGDLGVVVTVSGEIHGLSDLADLQDLFYADPAGDLRSDELWLHSDAGVSIRLQTDAPEVAVAPGGEAVSLLFGWTD